MASRSKSRRPSKRRSRKLCKYGVKKSGGCKKKPGSKRKSVSKSVSKSVGRSVGKSVSRYRDKVPATTWASRVDA